MIRRRLGRWTIGLFLGAGLAAACGGGNYTGAGIGLGAAVTGAGLNRAVTGDCWAACTPGYGCDRKRGTCVRVECVPECSADEHCVIEADGRTRCLTNPGTFRLGAGPVDAGQD